VYFVPKDGLFLITNKPELVCGYPLAILTPNINEHRRLVAKIMGSDDSKALNGDLLSQLKRLAEE
jgi:ATP-dependent NAD(P)H-hydrate dehydratase